MEELEINMIDGKAQVTRTRTVEEVTIYSKTDVEQEIAILQSDIDRLEEKKQSLQTILAEFEE